MPKFDPYADYNPHEYLQARADYARYMEEQDELVDPDDDDAVNARYDERQYENCSWAEWRSRKIGYLTRALGD